MRLCFNKCNMQAPDIVYMVKPTEDNEELRYSLRSLANIPHGKVFLAGYTPSWVQGVDSISRDQFQLSKYRNTTENLLAACHDERVSDDFILFNDDFFIVQPIPELPTLHRGFVYDVLEQYEAKTRSDYAQGMRETFELLRELGYRNPLSYELHIPMLINKQKFIEVIAKQRELRPDMKVVHKRTLYGNLTNMGGVKTKDVKVYDSHQQIPAGPFVSSSDASFKRFQAGLRIRHKFPAPSEYELEAVAA